MTRGGSREGALAAVAGVAIGLLVVLLTRNPVAVSTLVLAWIPAALSAALAGVVIGTWRPRSLGPIAFGVGLAVESVAGIALVQGTTVLLAWCLVAPLLATTVGAALVPLGLADPPAPAPPVRRPAWAERPLGPELGRAGSPPGDETPLVVGTHDRLVSPERAGAIWLAAGGAVAGWLTLFCGGVPLFGLWLTSVPGLVHDGPALVGDLEFWIFGTVIVLMFGVPGLVVATVALAGDRPRSAFLRGYAIAFGHSVFAGLWLLTIALTEQEMVAPVYLALSPVWILVPLAIGRWKARRPTDAAP